MQDLVKDEGDGECGRKAKSLRMTEDPLEKHRSLVTLDGTGKNRGLAVARGGRERTFVVLTCRVEGAVA